MSIRVKFWKNFVSRFIFSVFKLHQNRFNEFFLYELLLTEVFLTAVCRTVVGCTVVGQ